MKIGRETGIPSSVNHAAGDVRDTVRLSSASMAEPTVFNGRMTAQHPLTNVSVSDQRAHGKRTDVGCTVSEEPNITAWSKP